MEGNQSRGTRKKGPLGKSACWLVLQLLLSWLFHRFRPICPGKALPTVGWVFTCGPTIDQDSLLQTLPQVSLLWTQSVPLPFSHPFSVFTSRVTCS